MSLLILIGTILLVIILENRDAEKSSAIDSTAVKKADSGRADDSIIEKENSKLNAETSQLKTITNVSILADKISQKVVYEVFKISPEKGAVLYTNSGARILVPEFSFLDKNGIILKQEITLFYHEYLSLEETGLKKEENTFTPTLLIEIKAEESISKNPVALNKPIELESTTPIKNNPETVLYYSPSKEKWESVGIEKVSYRFILQFNESEFPELVSLNGLLLELPADAGKPSDFGYIFNRPWRNLSLTLSTKKELTLKNTNTTFNSVMEIGSLLGTKNEDIKLLDAFSSQLKNTTNENTKSLIANWKNSKEGSVYYDWFKLKITEDQYFSDRKTSKIKIKALGFSALKNSDSKNNSSIAYKRVLYLHKFPAKDQHFSKEEIQREPSLKR